MLVRQDLAGVNRELLQDVAYWPWATASNVLRAAPHQVAHHVDAQIAAHEGPLGALLPNTPRRWRRAARRRAISSSAPNGLVTQSSAPASSAATFAASSPRLDRTTIGTGDGRADPADQRLAVRCRAGRDRARPGHGAMVAQRRTNASAAVAAGRASIWSCAASVERSNPSNGRLVVDDQDGRGITCQRRICLPQMLRCSPWYRHSA